VGQEQILIGANDEPIGISLTVKTDVDPTNTLLMVKFGATVAEDLLSSSKSGADWLGGVVDVDDQSPLKIGLDRVLKLLFHTDVFSADVYNY
jgi:hypothetical protein